MLKRIIFFLVLIVISNPLFAGWATGAAPLEIRLPCFNTRAIMSFTGLYENFYTSELDYAARYQVAFVGGRFLDNNSDYDWGFAVGLGYIFPCSSNDVQLSYSYFDSEEVEHVRRHDETLVATLSDPIIVGSINISPVPGIIFASIPGSEIVVSPTGIVNFTFTPSDLVFARAISKFRNNVVDINFGQYVDVDEIFRIRGFAGVRYAYIKHNFDVNYIFAQTVSGTFLAAAPGDPFIIASATLNAMSDSLVAQRSQFTGLGPRLGFDSNLFLGNGFGLFGNLSGALLIGDINSKLFNVDRVNITGTTFFLAPLPVSSFSSVIQSLAIQPQPRIVPNLQAEVGIDYTYIWSAGVRSTVTLALGYKVDHYFNAVDRLASLNADVREFRTRHPLDVDFAGFFLRIEARV